MPGKNHITHYAAVMDDILKCRGVMTNGLGSSMRAAQGLADDLQEKVIVFAVVEIMKPTPVKRHGHTAASPSVRGADNE